MAKRSVKVGKNQIGFYLDDTEAELHVRPQAGDHMIRPDIEVERKPKTMNPWAEAMSFIKQQHHVGDLKWAEVGSVNGGITFFDTDGEHESRVGDTDGDQFIIRAEFVVEPRLNKLSPKAIGVYFALKSKEEGR